MNYTELSAIADAMRVAGVRRIELDGDSVVEVDLGDPVGADYREPLGETKEEIDPGDPDLCPACKVRKPEGVWKPNCRACGRRIAGIDP